MGIIIEQTSSLDHIYDSLWGFRSYGGTWLFLVVFFLIPWYLAKCLV